MPLPVAADAPASKGSLGAMMARRYDSYRAHVVKPFFRDHFARLDRQVVLVDALSALNAGPAAVADLGRALEAVLASFRPGANSWLSSVLGRRIDRIAFCATKADHLHHTSHDRLEAILGRLTQRAIQRAQFAGAQVRVLAIAAVRSTREAERRERGERLPLIVGVPMKGERVGTTLFDGEREVAFFPGDLPADPDRAIAAGIDPGEAAYRFLKFRPPRMTPLASEPCPPFAHIRLDRVLDFLIGDRMT
ncbi:MAG: YcjX family protein [Hyphomicrobiaceae bacterium]